MSILSVSIPSVVEGEASESDSEETMTEPKIAEGKNQNFEVPHGGVIVVGEAPESDDESTTLQSNSSKNEQPQNENTTPQTIMLRESPSGNHDSLLTRKLIECNLSLRNNILSLLKSTVNDSLEQLTEAEKLLVNSQMRVQRACGSIRTISSNSTLLTNKLAQSSSYLPQIHIPEDEI